MACPREHFTLGMLPPCLLGMPLAGLLCALIPMSHSACWISAHHACLHSTLTPACCGGGRTYACTSALPSACHWQAAPSSSPPLHCSPPFQYTPSHWRVCSKVPAPPNSLDWKPPLPSTVICVSVGSINMEMSSLAHLGTTWA